MASPSNSQEQPVLPRTVSLTIYVTAACLLVALLAVHVIRPWGWDADYFALVLVGALLLIPVAERLRKFKVGEYFEAEFENVRERVEHLGEWVSDLNDITLSPEEMTVASDRPSGEATSTTRASAVVAKTIRQIVWVDDNPSGNRLEIDELRRRFKVITATTTEQGLKSISSPEETLVITDAVRVEDDETDVNAGVELILALQEQHPEIPVYVYCGRKTASDHSDPLEDAGARLVTASFTDLASRIRADARMSFEAELAALLEARGSVEVQAAGVDFVLTLNGERIGVEAKDFRRTPKESPFDSAVKRLDDAVNKGDVDRGLLVTPKDVFVKTQLERTPSSVQLASIDQLSEALDRLPQP